MRRPFLSLALLCAMPIAAQTPLATQIAKILAEQPVANAHWGISVTAMDGTPVFAMNDAHSFLPASNAKLFTTAAAMALLGPGKVFTTQVTAHGRQEGTANLRGDLILKGAGDPNISGASFPWTRPVPRAANTPRPPRPDPLTVLATIADRVAATGLKHVTGDIVGDDTLFPWQPYAENWTIDDAVWGYGAPVSALTINDNLMFLSMASGSRAGDPVKLTFTPAMPWYTIDAHDAVTAAAGTGSHLDVERLPGSRTLRIYGTIAADAAPDEEEIAIDDPAAYAATALKMLLQRRGIVVDGTARAQHRPVTRSTNFIAESRRPVQLPEAAASATAYTDPCDNPAQADANPGCIVRRPLDTGSDPVLASYTSHTVAEDIMLTNKVSQNLHAELLLHQLGAAWGDASTSGGARVVNTWLVQRARVPNGDVMLFDGSGLSGHDLITPRAVTQLLRYAATQPWFAPWKTSLPVGGLDGTLRSRFPDAPLKEHLFAKTGTLSETRALGGYVECASGQTLVFSVIANTHTPRTTDDQKATDRIIAAIAAAN